MSKQDGIITLVIAVGGKGERMQSYFDSVGYSGSKVLFPINGEPLLKRYIDSAFEAGFDSIVLLINEYGGDIKKFIESRYQGNNRISFVETEDPSRKNVPGLLFEFLKKKNEPIVYMDGNLLFDTSIFNITRQYSFSSEIICAFTSRSDIAPTHALFQIINETLSSVYARPAHQPKKELEENEVRLCSMGILALHPDFFSNILASSLADDLDIVMEKVFAKNPNAISYKEYSGKWVALHGSSDIDKMAEFF